MSFFSLLLLFVLGQAILRLCIEPIQEHKRVVGRIANALTAHGNAAVLINSYRTDAEAKLKLDAAAAALHGLAADFRASTTVLPWYGLWVSFHIVHKRQVVWNVADHLLLWGGFNSAEDTYKRRTEIMSLLNLNFGKHA